MLNYTHMCTRMHARTQIARTHIRACTTLQACASSQHPEPPHSAATTPTPLTLQPQDTPLTTQWRRLSRTPSLDAWRLGQPAAPGSLCTTVICSALLAAGVDLNPSHPIRITPDPTNDLTALRANAQMELQRAAGAADAAAAQQRRVGMIAGIAVGAFVGVVLLAALAPRVWRKVAAARKRRAAERAAKGDAVMDAVVGGGAVGGGQGQDGWGAMKGKQQQGGQRQGGERGSDELDDTAIRAVHTGDQGKAVNGVPV